MPERRVRFSTNVRKPWSRTLRGTFCDRASTRSRVGSKVSIRWAKASPSRSTACQKAATSGSRSSITHCSTRPSITAVRDTMPPPQKGSTSSVGCTCRSQSRTCGMSQVLPPG